jgi:hypothetical protein
LTNLKNYDIINLSKKKGENNMPLVIFVLSILFLRGYNVGMALAVVGILNYLFAIFRNSVEKFKKSKERDFDF